MMPEHETRQHETFPINILHYNNINTFFDFFKFIIADFSFFSFTLNFSDYLKKFNVK